MDQIPKCNAQNYKLQEENNGKLHHDIECANDFLTMTPNA